MKKNYIVPLEEVFSINAKKSLMQQSMSCFNVKGSGSQLTKGEADFDDNSASSGKSGGDMWDKEW